MRPASSSDRASAAGDISDTAAAHRLDWNQCVGFTGAVQASAILRQDVNLATRIEDILDAHISAITMHSAQSSPDT